MIYILITIGISSTIHFNIILYTVWAFTQCCITDAMSHKMASTLSLYLFYGATCLFTFYSLQNQIASGHRRILFFFFHSSSPVLIVLSLNSNFGLSPRMFNSVLCITFSRWPWILFDLILSLLIFYFNSGLIWLIISSMFWFDF